MTVNKTLVNIFLVALILLDLAYFIVAFFFRDFWFAQIHGTPYDDPQGLLPRAGAVWFSFVVFQSLTLFKWRSRPYWLAITAGLRSAELFTEWTYCYFAHDLTATGKIGLLVSTPANMIICWFFFRTFLIEWRNLT